MPGRIREQQNCPCPLRVAHSHHPGNGVIELNTVGLGLRAAPGGLDPLSGDTSSVVDHVDPPDTAMTMRMRLI
jgi:hypothetical protein